MKITNDRQTLAKKLAYHLATIQAIRAGSTLRIGEAVSSFIDHGPITVLTRAALETFIVFAYLVPDRKAEMSIQINRLSL